LRAGFRRTKSWRTCDEREVGWRHVVGIVAIVDCVIPLLDVLSVSLANFRTLADTLDYWRWITNSLVVSTTTAIGTAPWGLSTAGAVKS